MEKLNLNEVIEAFFKPGRGSNANKDGLATGMTNKDKIQRRRLQDIAKQT